MTDQEIIKQLQDEINKEFRESTQELINYLRNEKEAFTFTRTAVYEHLNRLGQLHTYSETLWECWAIARKRND